MVSLIADAVLPIAWILALGFAIKSRLELRRVFLARPRVGLLLDPDAKPFD